MAWSMPLLSAAQQLAQSETGTTSATDPCFGQGALCGWVYEATGNETLAEAAAWVVGTPLRILLVVVLGLIGNKLARRFVHRVTDSISYAAGTSSATLLTSTNAQARAGERARALETVLKSLVSIAIAVVVLLVVLDSLGVDATTLIASAGVAGLALSIGAQSLVKDMIGGVTILVEDQYGIGDEVDLGLAVGQVEKVSLRATTVRDADGTLWYVPNGQIERVANHSQTWSRVVLDVRIPYEADTDRARQIVKEVADDLAAEPTYAPSVQGAPSDAVLQELATDAVVIRITLWTRRTALFEVERELRLRVKAGLAREGMAPALPRQEIALVSAPE